MTLRVDVSKEMLHYDMWAVDVALRVNSRKGRWPYDLVTASDVVICVGDCMVMLQYGMWDAM